MMGVAVGILVAIAFVVLERGCRDKPAPKGLTWFELIESGQIRQSKKSRGRGR